LEKDITMTMPPRRILAAMLVASPSFVASLLLVASLWALAPGNARADAKADSADSYDIGSHASQFLQSKTRMSVLERDDKADAGCQDKRFVRADPFRATELRMIGKVTERKWREIWTLARCGTDVDYMIIFTEVGDGGASYAIVGPQTGAEMDSYKNAELAAEPASKDFMIYFDTNKFDVGIDSTETLASVVNAAKQLGNPKVVLTGHTDTMGSSTYNKRLSEERTSAVKTYLTRHGILVSTITTVSMGETDQRLKTPNQTRAQENRNVRIELE
jgi:outer membrane protein OmpA-like peptidoglycan-associated protein